MPERLGFVGTRWLGVGLASALAVATIALWATGQLGLYINPDSAWFAVSMAVLLLIGSVASFLLPLGAEADHGHDHGDAPERDHDHDHDHAHRPAVGLGTVAAVAGGVVASGVVLSILVLPPASLSAEIAMSRDVGTAPQLFAGADIVALATTGDTSNFGVGDWASVFATATNPDAFEGDAVTLTGFVTPASSGDGFQLTRLVITHCVIDAQPASVVVAASGSTPATGEWVTITGTVRSAADGKLEVDASDVQSIAEPKDPYEY